MKLLLTTDLHLTDRDSDSYRWAIFSFIRQVANAQGCEALAILGDLTDRRDNHSSKLINTLIDEFSSLLVNSRIGYIVILGGNHDKPIGGKAYFEFLGKLGDSVAYISDLDYYLAEQWRRLPWDRSEILLLPYTSKPELDWQGLDLASSKCLMIHQAVSGAIAANGFKLEADCNVLFPRGGKIFSGHIHKPQNCGPVTYVGAPYHVAFGDIYEPRIVVYDTRTQFWESIPTGLTKKWVLSFFALDELDNKLNFLAPQDQVKLRYQAKQGEFDLHAIEQNARSIINKQSVSEIVFEAQLRLGPDDPSVENQARQDIATMDPEMVARQYLTEKNQESLIDLALEILKSEA